MDDAVQRLTAAVEGRYADLKPLAGAGMSEVFTATDVRFNRAVVIKLLPRRLQGPDALERFRREIELTAGLQHPQIVPLLDAGEVDGLPWFVMPFVQGESLRDRLQRGPLSAREAASILLDVAQALSLAHERGVVHRDIKPGNILLTRGSAVVADFGVAKSVSGAGARIGDVARTPELTEEGTSLGTPAYMSPEQVVGDPAADHRVDIYALGVVAYEMFTGTPPFRGETAAKLRAAQVAERPPEIRARRADVPPQLEALVMRCLAKDPADRPRTAGDIVRVLQSPDLLQADSAPVRPTDGGRGIAARAREEAGEFWRDIRRAARSLWRSPSVLYSTLFCLALGIGSTVAIFSAVDRALLQPLPFREPERLVSVFRTNPNFNRGPFSPANFLDLASEAPLFENISAILSTAALVEIGDRTIPASGHRVSGTLLPLLGAPMLLGRRIEAADDDLRQPPVAVVSESFWRSQLAGDPTAIGRPLRINGEPHVVVGVLHDDFRIPHATRVMRSDVWVPMRFSEAERATRFSNSYQLVGRLRPGVGVAAAQQDLVARFQRIVEVHPSLDGESVEVLSMAAEGSSSVRTPLLLLLSAAFAVLAIAVLNVSCLLLARGIRRQPELAVRSAIGATRWEVMRPVFAESTFVAVTGCALGIGLAWVGVRVIGAMAAQRMPQLAGLAMDARIIALAVGLALVAAALSALAPALRALRVAPAEALSGGRGGGTGGRQHRALGGLVVLEGALALALLISAGLVLKGFVRVLGNDPGFDAERMLTLSARISPADYADRPSVTAFLHPALEAVRAIPGVESAGAISLMPYRAWGNNFGPRYEGQSDDNASARPLVEMRAVEPGFFGVTRQRLIAGRLLDAGDASDAAPARVVVNEALVARDYAGRDPIGQRFHWGNEGFATIVGVVSDIRNLGPVAAPGPEMYFPYELFDGQASGFSILVRTASADPVAVGAAIETALRGVDPRVAVSQMMPMREVIARSLGRPRFLFTLMGTFAAVALLLAVAGLFGLLTYAVEQRRRELGLRAALGAVPRSLAALVMRRGGAMVGASVVVGLAISWVATRALQSMLYGVQPSDAIVWSAATLAMLIAGLLAALAPAWRAARIEPMVAMRSD